MFLKTPASVPRYTSIMVLPLLLTVAAQADRVAVRPEPNTHVYAVSADLNGRHVVTSRWEDRLDRRSASGHEADTFNTSEGDVSVRDSGTGTVTDYYSLGKNRGIVASPTGTAVEHVPIEVLRKEALHVGNCSFDALVVRDTFSAHDYPDEGDNYARLVTEAPQSSLVVSFDLDDNGDSCPTSAPST